MLGQGSLSHLVPGAEHGLQGSQVLLLYHLLEQFLVVPGKVGILCGDICYLNALGHLCLDVPDMVPNIGNAVLGFKGNGLCLGLSHTLFNALLVNSSDVHCFYTLF